MQASARLVVCSFSPYYYYDFWFEGRYQKSTHLRNKTIAHRVECIRKAELAQRGAGILPEKQIRLFREFAGRFLRTIKHANGGERTLAVSALRDMCAVEMCGQSFKQPGTRSYHSGKTDLATKGWESRPPRKPWAYSGTCHGYKLQADHRLCLGDRLGYLLILNRHNFDLRRAEQALSLYRL